MGSNITIIQKGAGREHQRAAHVADLRVKLKISALAYCDVRHGGDGPGLLVAAVDTLCGCAERYYAALAGNPGFRAERPTSHGDLPAPGASRQEVETVAARAAVKIAAIGYGMSRHGVDACMEYTRAAIGVLCQAAIGYCAAASGAADVKDVVDRTMRLDDGR
jgi:hypothetical protein